LVEKSREINAPPDAVMLALPQKGGYGALLINQNQ
jgi:hypothetical protein